jgi:hypothetical protein
MKQYAVIHVEKCKPNTYALGRHLNRERVPENADKKLSGLNQQIIGHGENMNKAIEDRIKEGYTGKTAIRKDAVKSLSIVMTGTHEIMKELETKGKLKEWIQDNGKFLSERYGRQNIVSLHLHMDERTPHLHAVIVPLTKDGRLSAREIVGNRKDFQLLQDNYAAQMAHFGFVRGEKYSRAKHEDVKEYYKRVNEPVEGVSFTPSFWESKQNSVERMANEIVVPLMQKINDQEIKLKKSKKEQEEMKKYQERIKIDAEKRKELLENREVVLKEIALGKIIPEQLKVWMIEKGMIEDPNKPKRTPNLNERTVDDEKDKKRNKDRGMGM